MQTPATARRSEGLAPCIETKIFGCNLMSFILVLQPLKICRWAVAFPLLRPRERTADHAAGAARLQRLDCLNDVASDRPCRSWNSSFAAAKWGRAHDCSI